MACSKSPERRVNQMHCEDDIPEPGDEDKILRFDEFDILVQADLRRVMERIAATASSPA